MLVLTRRVGEILSIGDNVAITVVEINGGQVKLGIEAPRDVIIVRSELPSAPSNPAVNELKFKTARQNQPRNKLGEGGTFHG